MPPKKRSGQKIERDPYQNAEWDKLQDDVVACVFERLDYTTAAALCLATPRQGLAAIKEHWKEDPAFAFAMWFHHDDVSPVELIEKYLNDPKADSKHFEWMNTCLSSCVVEVTEVTRDGGIEEDWTLSRLRFKPRLVRKRLPDGTLYYYRGPGEKEYKVRCVRPNGILYYYLGPKGRESVERVERAADGAVLFYEGDQNKEALRRARYPDGAIHHFEGARTREYLVRRDLPDGSHRVTEYYEGIKGQEILVRIDYRNGQIQHYEPVAGPPGSRATSLKRVVLPSNRVFYYEGPPGIERMVRVVTDPVTAFFEGDKGQERIVRKVHHESGSQSFYRGEKGKEHVVRAVRSDGLVVDFEGVKNKERKVRAIDVDGRIRVFEGDRGDERLVRTVWAPIEPAQPPPAAPSAEGSVSLLQVRLKLDGVPVLEPDVPVKARRAWARAWARAETNACGIARVLAHES